MKTTLLAASLVLASCAAMADEGMWTPDNLPLAQLASQHQFKPDAAWVAHAREAAVRIAGGCSASFVSPQGLVLTNHHCVNSCVQQLSSADRDFIKTGFLAKSRAEEIRCPEIELNRLDAITDVSQRVKAATQGKSGEAFSRAEKAVKSQIEKECAGKDSATTRCDVVTLYHGGKYDVYKYHRYQDVRLVFAPEFAAAFFGGDPDNFNFPRYDLDMGMLRAWENGKPAKVKDYFPFSKNGAADGDLTIVVGNPGGTDRQLTVAQLESARDVELLHALLRLSEMRGLLTQFGNEGAEHARISRGDLFGVENSYKVLKGRLEALQDPKVFELKRRQEAELRDWVDADPARKARFGAAWEQIAAAEAMARNLEVPYQFEEGRGSFFTRYYSIARALVRGAQERAKPDAERLREFTDARLPALTQQLFSSAPIYPDYEKVKLGWSLTKMREWLGTDDPFVKTVLGKQSPQQVADALVDGTKLGDVALRKQLWEGGAKAVDASHDPFIEMARRIDPQARAIRKQMEDEVDSVIDKNAELIAAARFEKYGTSVYPDATFTQRFSFGTVKGWDEKGKPVKPFTDYAGAFEHATGAPPFELPPSWLDAKSRLDLAQHLNLVTTNDIIGGNSGSPMINRDGEIVGLIFDGNIHSLGGDYWYDAALNRAVAVDSGGILEALRTIYRADDLVQELQAAPHR